MSAPKTTSRAPSREVSTARTARGRRGELAQVTVQPSEVVAAAGTAIVTAARVGRILGRSGWRIARQLPGGKTIEREAQKIQQAAVNEARRLLQVPQADAPRGKPATPEEERAALLIQTADPGTAPLRSAMGELLERSVEASRSDSREYLFGTIISQLVPDEARILAALSSGSVFAAGDLVQRSRRSEPRVLVANASTVGRSAGVVTPDNTPTYLSRLLTFGLIEFGPEDESLELQYDMLATDNVLADARRRASAAKQGGGVKLVRKTVRMSSLGQEFWAASDPTSRHALPSG
ncbi:MAG: hypothetical protein JWQ77_843 [Jatrophihabitans sp.]|nr:hypothetical protein [Jatrophihabitans sp.]